MGQPSNQNLSQPHKATFLPKIILKSLICKLQILYSLLLLYMLFLSHLYVIRMSLVCTRMSPVFHMPLVCHPCVFVCYPYATRMYLYVIRMSLLCTPYVTHMPIVCGFTINPVPLTNS